VAIPTNGDTLDLVRGTRPGAAELDTTVELIAACRW
jgi:hypothetical protein